MTDPNASNDCCGLACHAREHALAAESAKIAIVGSPNVGKSVLFNRLTGRYVTVSNYPGTTVELARGSVRIGDRTYQLIDTPGLYLFSPINEEERVARAILLHERPTLVLHVVEAASLERMLPFTLQLIEAGLPAMLVLNMMDEARKAGLSVNAAVLERELGIPVVPISATRGEGIAALRERMRQHAGD